MKGLPGGLLAALDTAVFALLEGECALELLTAPPRWLVDAQGDIQPGARLSGERVPVFLADFAAQVREHWSEGKQNALRSGPWIERGPSGQDWPLEAVARLCDGQELLIVEHLAERYAEHSAALQAARENRLAQEQLEAVVVRRTREIRQREAELVHRLLVAGSMRDRETGAHIRRIGLYSAAMARALGWNSARVEDLQLAAPMHDIGKIAIPDRILQKPERLEAWEFEIMKTHTSVGAQILENSPVAAVELARRIALEHHERWDGSGYPRGLVGAAISDSARIVAIVDVYDALSQARVYKSAQPEDMVVDTLTSGAARHFDPQLLHVFLGIVPEMRAIREAHPDDPR